MYNSLSHKTKQFFWLILKIAIVFLCAYFIYLKLFQNEKIIFSDFKQILLKNNAFSLKNILLLLIFTFFNWFFEILKWKNLVSSIQKISFFEASKQSLSSLTTSLITPNRVGEYPAKAIYFEKEKRKQILGLNFIHNIFQLSVTIIFGIFGISFLLFKNKITVDFSLSYLILSVLIPFIVLLILAVRKIDYLKNQLQKIKVFNKKISTLLKRKIILLSIIRYLFFSHQFYFLLLIFNTDIHYFEAISAISAMYLIASIIPILSLFDVILKSAVAVFIFSFFEVEEIKIISISLLMWIFNFVFPALIGSYFVFTFKPKLAI